MTKRSHALGTVAGVTLLALLFVTQSDAQTSAEAGAATITSLRTALKSPSRDTREKAAYQLADVPTASSELAELVGGFLADPNHDVRLAALFALKQHAVSPSIRPLLLSTLTTSTDSKEKRASIDALVQSCDTACNDALASVALSADGDTGKEAVLALLTIVERTRGETIALASTLKALHAEVRREAARALKSLSTIEPSSIDALLIAVNDSNEDVQVAALEAVGAFTSSLKSAPPAVITATAAGRTERVRLTALDTLGGFSDDGAVDTLRSNVADASSRVRAVAIAALARAANHREATPTWLSEELTDPSAEAVLAALDALATLHYTDAATRAAVRQLLSHVDADIRKQAVAYFSALEPEANEQAEALIALIDDPVASIRIAAMGALRNTVTEDDQRRTTSLSDEARSSVVQRLVLIASDHQGRPDVRDSALLTLASLATPDDEKVCQAAVTMAVDPFFADTAVTAFGRLGRQLQRNGPSTCAAPLVTHLTALSTSPDPVVRKAVAVAISEIRKDDDNDSWAKEIYAVLPRLATDQTSGVRQAVADGLDERLDDETVLAALVESLRDTQPSVRRTAVKAAGQLSFEPFAVGVLVGTKSGHRLFGPTGDDGARALALASPRLAVLRLVADLSLRTDASGEEVRDLGNVLADASAMLENLTSGPLPRQSAEIGIRIEDETRSTVDDMVKRLLALAASNVRSMDAVVDALAPHVTTYPAVADRIKSLATSGPPAIRATAIAALAALADDPDIDALVHRSLTDEDERVRHAALRVVVALGSVEELATARRAAHADDQPTQEAALMALARSSEVDLLLEILREETSARRRENTLRFITSSKQVSDDLKDKALSRAVADPDRSVRETALYAIGRLASAGDETLDALASLCAGNQNAGSEHSATRALGADTVANLAEEQIELAPRLRCFLTDPVADVRQRALASARKLGRLLQTLGPEIVQLASDPDRSVQLEALKTIAAVRPRVGVPGTVLVSALRNSDSEMRSAALAVMQAMGVTGTSALSAAANLLKDDQVGGEAVKALESAGSSGLRHLRAAQTDAEGVLAQSLGSAAARVERRLRPPVLTMHLAIGGTKQLRVDDDTMVFLVASWCPYSKELIEFLHEEERAAYFRGLRAVFLFVDEWDDVRSHLREALKKDGKWSEDTEEALVRERKALAGGTPVYDPALLESLRGSVFVVSKVEGLEFNGFPMVFNNDTGRLEDRSEWGKSAWFERRIGMPDRLTEGVLQTDLFSMIFAGR